MPPRFDLYVRRNSWLHRLDPRVKFMFVLEATALPFVWPTIWAAAGLALACLLLFWSGKVPRARLAEIWRTMAPLLLLVFGLSALLTQAGGPPVWLRLGPLAVTRGAVLLGLMLALRLLALALVIFLWLFTTDQATMIKGFLALHLPYTWGLTLALALRYLPVFAGLFTQVREAQQARGLDLDQGSFWRRVRLQRPILIAMIIIAVRQSEQLGWALEARALGAPNIQRTIFRPLRLKRSDWTVAAFLLAILAAGVTLRVL